MSKKGSAIVEAAMVFPVMLLAVISILYMLIYFYNQVDNQIKLHIALRSENGEVCNNMYYENKDNNNLSVYRKGALLFGYSTISLEDKGILTGRDKLLYDKKYITDEVMIVRIADLAETAGTNNE